MLIGGHNIVRSFMFSSGYSVFLALTQETLSSVFVNNKGADQPANPCS